MLFGRKPAQPDLEKELEKVSKKKKKAVNEMADLSEILTRRVEERLKGVKHGSGTG